MNKKSGVPLKHILVLILLVATLFSFSFASAGSPVQDPNTCTFWDSILDIFYEADCGSQYVGLTIREAGDKQIVPYSIVSEEDYNNDGIPDVKTTFQDIGNNVVEITATQTNYDGKGGNAYKWSSAICPLSSTGTITKEEYNPATQVWTNTGALTYDTLWGMNETWCAENNRVGYSLYGAGSGNKTFRLHLPSDMKDFKFLTGKGTEEVVYVLQNQSTIQYLDVASGLEVNNTLKKFNGLEYVLAPDQVWINQKGNDLKFGANDTYATNDTEYVYELSSNKNIWHLEGTKWVVDIKGDDYQIVDFADVCKYQGCEYESNHTELKVYFTGEFINTSNFTGIIIDPSYTTIATSGNLYNNTQYENNGNIHLDINDTGYRYATGFVQATSNSYVNINNFPMNNLLNNYTLSFWFNGGSQDSRGIATALNLSGSGGFYVLLLGSKVRFLEKNTTGTTQLVLETTTGADNTWNHYSLVSNQTHLVIYRDGVYDNSVAKTFIMDANSGDLHFGNAFTNNNGYQMQGSLDNFIIWNKALNSTEALEVYNEGRDDYSISLNDASGYWSFDDISTQWDSSIGSATGVATSILYTKQDHSLSNHTYADLVGYWSFDADSSTTTYDLTENNNDGTITGAINTSGVYSSAKYFDGTNDVIVINDITLDASDGGSASLWFKTNSFGYSAPTMSVMLGKTSSSTVYLYADTSTSIKVQGNSVGVANFVVPTMSPDTWYHVAFVKNNSQTRLWLNGVESSTGAVAQTQDMTISRIGAYSILGYLNGSIDEVMLFSKALNSTQISEIYNNQSARFVDEGTVTFPPASDGGLYNYVNISIPKIESLFESNISARTGYWSIEQGYNLSKDNLADGLVSYYRGDNNALDTMGLNNATLTNGAVANSDGIYNYSFETDGINDFVNISSTKIISNINDNSMSFWVKSDDLNQIGCFVYIGTVGVCQGGASNENTGALLRVIHDYVSWDNSPITMDTNWHYITFVRSGSNNYLYYDGVLVLTTTRTPNTANDLGSAIGAREGSTARWFDGYVDEVMIYNRSLSIDEIRQLYTLGLANWNYTDWVDVPSINSNVSIFLNGGVDYARTFSPELKMNTSTKFYTPYVSANLSLSPLTVPPTINFLSGTSNGTQPEGSQTIVSNVSTQYASSVITYLYYSNGTLYSSITNTTSPAINIWTSVPFGDYLLNATAFADDGTNVSTGTNAITLSADTTDPFIEFISPTPANDTTHGGDNILELYTNQTDANPKNVTYYLFHNNGTLVDSQAVTWTTSPETLNWNFTIPISGMYYWYNATACDDYDNCNSTETRRVYVDFEFAVIDLILPLWENLYESTYVPLSYFASDPSGVAQVWYNVLYSSNGTNSTYISNTTLSGNTTITITDVGSYYLILEANDTTGNVGRDLTFFDVTNVSAGPEGPQGPTGPQGPQGPQGEPGVNGTSASELDCYIDTEWQESNTERSKWDLIKVICE